MVELTERGVNLNSPYGELKLRFGRSRIVEIPDENIRVSAPRNKFVELAQGAQKGSFSPEVLDLLKKISDLPLGWKQSTKVRTLLDADTGNGLKALRKEVDSKLEEIEQKREEAKKSRETWERVEEKGYYIREYRGSKLRYLIICGGHRHNFYIIQVPPEYDFEIYPGKSSNTKTLGRRLRKSPSKLIESYNPGRKQDAVENLHEDKRGLENLRNALNDLPQPQKGELEKRLVALKLTGKKK